jgi:hypothetical protein
MPTNQLRSDEVKVWMKRHQRGQPNVFCVSFRTPQNGQYWGKEFRIRDSLSNPTKIGKAMGIRTRDKRISIFSDKGKAIQDYLHRLARKYAGSLSRDVTDTTGYAHA